MKPVWMQCAAVALACALAGCNHAKTEAQVANDTSAARQKAAENVASAQQNADAKVSAAEKDVGSEQRDLAHVASAQDEKVAETAAEGQHKVALARCEALSGNAQKSCTERADADYALAKDRAKLARAESDPKP